MRSSAKGHKRRLEKEEDFSLFKRQYHIITAPKKKNPQPDRILQKSKQQSFTMCNSTLVHYSCGHCILNFVYCEPYTKLYTMERHLARSEDFHSAEYQYLLTEVFELSCLVTPGGTETQSWDDAETCEGFGGLCSRDPNFQLWNIGWTTDGRGPLDAPYRDLAHWVEVMRGILEAMHDRANGHYDRYQAIADMENA
ncbi:hypothetical protein DL95DRAFT_505603 [Leptodontidium sp. 2 PMI_412]|nr:hypothetical protein DL95DRAFT_505603 [Leptodontidium sp. 2 PMI_412]